ncbi:MAG: inositol monophosphatase family protein [Thioalkalispiraceae bacterium]|jgi:myo-inositol-1(or 4)-monophosphatase
MFSLPDSRQLIDIVRKSAKQELLTRFERVTQTFKTDGSIITDADLAMQKALFEGLQSHWPEIPFLGEEMAKQEQLQLLSQTDKGLWVVDPIDGTTNFSLGIPFYAVSVALIQDNQVQLGVVYDPARDECFNAIRGQGAFLNGKSLDLIESVAVDKITVAEVDFKRLSPELTSKIVSHPPYKSQRSFGSVALDWCWLAAGRGDVYLHGRQNLWDFAAGCLILEEAGGISSTLNGEPVFNGSLEPRSAVIAINQQLYHQWYGFLTS